MKKWLAGAATVVAAGALVGIITRPSEAASAPAAGGVYTIASGASGKCLDVASAGTANGGLLVQVACNAAAADQQFRASSQSGGFGLVNGNSGKCVDIPYSATTSGTQLWQWTCGASTNQTWSFTASTAAAGKFLIKSALNGLCISNKDGSTAGNNPIVQETCSDISRLQWSFNQVSGPTGSPTTGPTGSSRWSNKADGFAGTGGGTTGGAGGTTVTVKSYDDLNKYATAPGAYVIKVSGTITYPTMGYEVRVTSNKTIVGLGTTGRIYHGGFFLAAGVKNVIIRNLTIGDTAMTDDDPDDKTYDYDGIQMDTADHIWIDHNKFQNINDGMIDSRKDTSYVTTSWNIFGAHNKTYGIGWTNNVTARMTIHHNWTQASTQRNPSVDNVAYAHLYNNYQQNTTSYGNLSRGSTKMVLENSYFDHVNNPWNIDDTTKGQLKQSGSIAVSCTGKQVTGGSAFTPSSFYSYTLDKAADVPSVVKAGAGPQADISM